MSLNIVVNLKDAIKTYMGLVKFSKEEFHSKVWHLKLTKPMIIDYFDLYLPGRNHFEVFDESLEKLLPIQAHVRRLIEDVSTLINIPSCDGKLSDWQVFNYEERRGFKKGKNVDINRWMIKPQDQLLGCVMLISKTCGFKICQNKECGIAFPLSRKERIYCSSKCGGRAHTLKRKEAISC